jgi:hypothetical protein
LDRAQRRCSTTANAFSYRLGCFWFVSLRL